MTVFVLIREDQNEHGYVDTSIAGVFREAASRRRWRPSSVCMRDRRGLWWKTTTVLTASGRCRGRSRNTRGLIYGSTLT